ncbi:Fez family zinc finger protein [Actinidia chinensis var. chinensis]|uniref:Fez family zinc finger protein n=1 Tax=Actinidia chinensis var. chinensis TaxID=1590841 RepID=A0A2R6Q081_ACTCC|nr:Fez family zinc finger protein [Actinidia chinensis var. chinensis]
MNPLCNCSEILPFKSPPLPLASLLPYPKFKPQFPHHVTFKPNFTFQFKPPILPNQLPWRPIKVTVARNSEIDMVRTTEGVYAPKPKKVVVLWDLDNKPPRGPPYLAALALRRVAERFGEVVDISAYANRHAFVHLPHWVIEERRERRRLDFLERKGAPAPSPEIYNCAVCGRKFRTNLDLKKHFRQLHERERQKKLNRMRSLKGKKRQRYKERFVSNNHKYMEAARDLITPKVGYGLASELKRAGVYVKTVEDKPQAADWALKKQMQHSLSRGIDWLFLVSDDSDFSEMLRRARESNLGTVVVGDWDRALGRHADLWVPWAGVENGEISDKDLRPRRRERGGFVKRGDGSFSVSGFDGEGGGEGNLDSVVDELVGLRTDFHSMEISTFSDGEAEENGDYEEDGDFLYDSEDEDSEDDDDDDDDNDYF